MLDPESIKKYRKIGCIFSNKFYSHGAVLNFEVDHGECIAVREYGVYYRWRKICK